MPIFNLHKTFNRPYWSSAKFKKNLFFKNTFNKLLALSELSQIKKAKILEPNAYCQPACWILGGISLPEFMTTWLSSGKVKKVKSILGRKKKDLF